MSERIARILRAFRLPGELAAAEPWGSGHINETWRVSLQGAGAGAEVLLQRINDEVFADPRLVTETIRRVGEHLRARLRARGIADWDRRTLTLHETHAGEVCHQDEDGTWWRAFRFLHGTRSFDQPRGPEMARAAAYAFGAFQRDLADLPPPRLPETIPHFHDAARRFAAFEAAVAADREGRAAAAAADIDFAAERREMTGVLPAARAAGELPERITHSDTKLNNLLFDEQGREALCVIDLDTVMPGLGLHDFGDLVRTCTSPTPEDERQLERVRAEPRSFEALARGWLDALGDLLTPRERELMPFAGRLMTYQIGLRFLTDHLAGDAYFRIHRPGHNLDRARAQFALLRSLEEQDGELSALVLRAG